MPKRTKEGKKSSNKTDHRILRYKRGKTTFEVLCNQRGVEAFRKLGGASVDDSFDWRPLVESETIFTDVGRGHVANASELDGISIPLLFSKGTIVYTTKELSDFRDAKKAQIIHHIHTTYVNPKNDKPYSTAIIETVLSEIRLVVDSFAPAITQFEKVRRRINDKIILKAV